MPHGLGNHRLAAAEGAPGVPIHGKVQVGPQLEVATLAGSPQGADDRPGLHLLALADLHLVQVCVERLVAFPLTSVW